MNGFDSESNVYFLSHYEVIGADRMHRIWKRKYIRHVYIPTYARTECGTPFNKAVFIGTLKVQACSLYQNNGHLDNESFLIISSCKCGIINLTKL